MRQGDGCAVNERYSGECTATVGVEKSDRSSYSKVEEIHGYNKYRVVIPGR